MIFFEMGPKEKAWLLKIIEELEREDFLEQQ